jgi:nucleotide-sensitive chloride channel 1A
MPLTTIHVAPALDTFTPLAEHQAQTPEVFFGAKPILHYHAVGARALISRDQVSKLPIFTEAAQAGDALVAEVVDAFVGSE